jgi:hypothetical protein
MKDKGIECWLQIINIPNPDHLPAIHQALLLSVSG